MSNLTTSLQNLLTDKIISVKTAIAKEGIVIATFQDGHVGLYKVTGAPFYTLAPISGWTDNLSNSSIRIGSNSPLAIASNERVSLVAFGRRDGFVALMEVPSLAMGPSPSFPKNAGSELLSPTDGTHFIIDIAFVSDYLTQI